MYSEGEGSGARGMDAIGAAMNVAGRETRAGSTMDYIRQTKCRLEQVVNRTDGVKARLTGLDIPPETGVEKRSEPVGFIESIGYEMDTIAGHVTRLEQALESLEDFV